MALFWLFCLLNIRHAVLSIDHAYGMPIYKLSLATRLHGKYLIEDALNKRSAKHANKSTLVADKQLGSSCVLAPLATNVDLWKPINMFLFLKLLVLLKHCCSYIL